MRSLIYALFVVLVPSLASATIVRSLTVEQMAQGADAVILGTVSKQTSGWNEGKTRIYTVTSISVTQSWKGSHTVGSVIDIRQIGGTVGQLTQTVVGNAKFTVGEDVVVFLERSPTEDMYFVMGMAQGRMGVVPGPNGPVVKRPSLHGIELVSPPTGQVRLANPHAPAASADSASSLEALRSQVLNAISR